MHLISKALAGGGPALFGLAVAVAGSLAGTSGAYAQPGDCSCMAAGTTGLVESARGNVFVSQATGSVAAKPNMSLAAGDSIVVGPESASTVRFGRNCQLRLKANTTFEVRPRGDLLCLVVNEQGGGAVGHTWLAPALIGGGIGLGVLAIASSDHEKSASK